MQFITAVTSFYEIMNYSITQRIFLQDRYFQKTYDSVLSALYFVFIHSFKKNCFHVISLASA